MSSEDKKEVPIDTSLDLVNMYCVGVSRSDFTIGGSSSADSSRIRPPLTVYETIAPRGEAVHHRGPNDVFIGTPGRCDELGASSRSLLQHPTFHAGCTAHHTLPDSPLA